MSRQQPFVAFSDEALVSARERLAAYEVERKQKDRLSRLRHAAPRHPLLLGMGFTVFATVALSITGIALAIGPFVSDSIFRWFGSIPGIELFPPALLALAFCSALIWGVLYGLALSLGEDAPLLPRDLQELNRLRSEVQRLTVAKDVQKRLTGTPAPVRGRSYTSP